MTIAFINRLLLLSFLLPSMVMANNSSVTQVETLLSRHINASGGEGALMQMQSISRYGQISFYAQDKLKEKDCYHTDLIYPKKLREQIKGKQIEYDRGTNGELFWLWTGSQYESTEDKDLINYMRDTAERANRDLLWVKKESNHYEVLPTPPSWAPNNSQCIEAIKVKDSIKRVYCFNPSTGLLNALGSAMEYRLESDWREVGNIKLPFHLIQYRNDVMVYEIQLDHAKLNGFIPDAQFLKPSSPQLNCH